MSIDTVKIIKNKLSTCLIIFLLINIFACSNYKQFFNAKKNTITSDETNILSKNQALDDSKFNDYKIIKFGKFEQDGDISNGKENISWIVLNDTGAERVLLSKDVLYAMPYDDNIDFGEEDFNQNWEKSSLRKWLNESFFNEAFSDDEKKFITTSLVKNGQVFGINNSREPDSMGADTNDNVYILSKDEIRKYLGFESEGNNINYLANPSTYAKEILDKEKEKESIAVWHKEQEYDEAHNNYAEYWVRSSVGHTTMTADEFFTDIVDKSGHISNHGFPYYVSKGDKDSNLIKERFYSRGVRPAIKIVGTSLDEEEQHSYVREEKKASVYDIKDINEAYMIGNYEKTKGYKDFDSVVLGSYEQDGDTANGKEGIEWLVLKKDEDKALLLSKYILDYVEYSNILEKYTTWKDSRLRAWSNHEFFEGSFNEQEKVLIASMKIKNYDNPVYNNSSGADTVDKVFAPSFDELMETFDIDYDECMKEPYYDYKKIDDARLVTIYTDFALKKYRKEKNNNKAVPLADFWLRNQGRSGEEINSRSSNAMIARETIDFKGSPYDLFQYSNDSEKTITTNPKLGFRPCIYVDLSVLNEFDIKSYDERTDKIFSQDISDSVKYNFDDIDKARLVTAYNNKATIANYDVVSFGSYEQDGNLENGKEEIEWIVLDKKGNEYLLLSKYVLDYYKFYKEKAAGGLISWNNSEIRTWANAEFMNTAFTENEQKNIMQSSVDNTVNEYYNLRPSEDKIFLLSIDEILKYFGNKNENYDELKADNYIVANDKTRTFATTFARDRGVIIGGKSNLTGIEDRYSCGYYTRSMFNSNYNQVIYIKDNGSDGHIAAYDTWKRFGFRPAMWVKIG